MKRLLLEYCLTRCEIPWPLHTTIYMLAIDMKLGRHVYLSLPRNVGARRRGVHCIWASITLKASGEQEMV